MLDEDALGPSVPIQAVYSEIEATPAAPFTEAEAVVMIRLRHEMAARGVHIDFAKVPAAFNRGIMYARLADAGAMLIIHKRPAGRKLLGLLPRHVYTVYVGAGQDGPFYDDPPTLASLEEVMAMAEAMSNIKAEVGSW